MPIDLHPGGTDIVDRSGNGMGADINSDLDFVFLTDNGLEITGKVLTINGIQVVGPRVAGMPIAAVDPATTMALVNYIRTVLLAHGLSQ